MYRRFVLFVLFQAIAICFWSCGSSSKKDILRVGIQVGPEYRLAETAKAVAKEKFNLDVELVTFNDYVMPNEALNQKEIDVNVFQTRPYLEEQSKARGYELEIVGNTFVYPMAGYSKKIQNLNELKTGDAVAVPNDPSNLGRALLLMQNVGLIELDSGVGLLPTLQNIKQNKFNLQILELEAPQLPRVLDDKKVTVAIINSNFAANHNLAAKRDGLFMETDKSPYVNIIVTRKDNKDDEKVRKFVQSYQSDAVEAAAELEFKGGAVKGW